VLLVGTSHLVTKTVRHTPQCGKCFRIDHSTHCLFEPRCKSCGEPPHEDGICPNSARCINCSLVSHVTGSLLCPTFIENKAICKLASEHDITFLEARRRYSLSKSPPSPPQQSLKPSEPLVQSFSFELEDLKNRFSLLETKVDNIETSIAPLSSLRDDVSGLVANMMTKVEQLLPMISIVSSLQGDFAQFRSQFQLAPSSLPPPCPEPPKSPSAYLSNVPPPFSSSLRYQQYNHEKL